jgi:hypothetical protein
VPDIGATAAPIGAILPDTSHFAAEFDKYCANPARPFKARQSLGASGNLLAMQRDAL